MPYALNRVISPVLSRGPEEEVIRRHHAALDVPCGEVHEVSAMLSRIAPGRLVVPNGAATRPGTTASVTMCCRGQATRCRRRAVRGPVSPTPRQDPIPTRRRSP